MAENEKLIEQRCCELLKARGMTFAAAESCTGGLLAKRITDISGASHVFLGGVTVYSNESKTSLLGIDPALIESRGAISRDVAAAMAKGVREKLGTDLGLGITGLAGPETDGRRDVGSVFVALDTKDGVFVRELHLGFGRARIRVAAVNHGLDMTRRYLTGLTVE